MESPYFTEEHDMIREQVRKFIDREVRPHGEAWEAEGKVPREVLRKMGDLGLLSMRHPEKYGGAGLDARASVVLAEELGRSTFGGFAATVAVHTDMATPHLIHAGSEAQKERYLPDIAAGRKITAVAVTEPDGGSDVARLRTKAVRDGDGWLLNGAKTFITNGVHADLLFVAARTDPDAKRSRGISMFIVEKDAPGFRVAKQLKKTGWHCSDTAELVFEDCRLPADALLGEENAGFYAIMRNFQNERMVIGATCTGEAIEALAITLRYVRERQAFGGPLWEMQTIRQRLAALAGQVEAGRRLVHHAAWLDSQGRDCVKEMSMVKAYWGELVNRVLYDCVQFHGGMGYISETAIERMARDTRVNSIGGGATEVMLEEVAKRLDPDMMM